LNSRELYGGILNTKKENRIDLFKYKINKNFNDNINSEIIYKNYNPEDIYNTWIYDKHSVENQFERKYIRMELNKTITQGEYIHWNNDTWIVMGVDTQYEFSQVGMIYKCIQQKLKWIDDTGKHTYDIFSQSKVLRDPLLDNGKVFLVDDSAEVYIQKNSDTLKLYENQRFLFGDRTAFKIIEVIDYYIENTIKLLLKKDEVTVGDDFTTGLARNIKYDYLNDKKTKIVDGTTEYIITPIEDDKIVIGQTQVFTINKYINGILVVFNSTITQPLVDSSFSFSSTLNEFTIQNNSQSNLDITVTTTDTDSLFVFEKIYELRMW